MGTISRMVEPLVEYRYVRIFGLNYYGRKLKKRLTFFKKHRIIENRNKTN